MLKPYQFFEKRGYDPSILSVSGMAAGLATHELLGFSWLFGSWTICYKLQPARHLASVGPWSNSETVRNWREQGKDFSSRLRKRPAMVWFSNKTSLDSVRFAASGAESYVLRKCLWPVTIPLKIYLAYRAAVFVSGSVKPKNLA
ncbi:hypothetical protein AAMO2058_001742100 [Amorphochlora amoebiformis]|mmetsp:Transcript_29015/g.46354  ORF Transcript_29015/g.46354 Transcript_29015/m.46354 type:complete len:144 (-) Transcript_29015:29-460(-)